MVRLRLPQDPITRNPTVVHNLPPHYKSKPKNLITSMPFLEPPLPHPLHDLDGNAVTAMSPPQLQRLFPPLSAMPLMRTGPYAHRAGHPTAPSHPRRLKLNLRRGYRCTERQAIKLETVVCLDTHSKLIAVLTRDFNSSKTVSCYASIQPDRLFQQHSLCFQLISPPQLFRCWRTSHSITNLKPSKCGPLGITN